MMESLSETWDSTADRVDQDHISSASSSSSKDSYSDSEESNSDNEAAQPSAGKPTVSKHGTQTLADEGCFGLHRNMWHVMILAKNDMANLPSFEGNSFKTACGRHLADTKVSIAFDLDLSSGQSMCSHGGCRKAFQCLEVIGH